jgi:signal transduction histidine kinase
MAQVVDGKLPGVRNAEVVIERPDSSRITVIVNIRPLKNQSGKVTGAINCFYDITERQQMEAALRQQTEVLADLHRRKDEFLAILSHELRNPLTPILAAVEILRVQIDQSEFQQQARQIIERQLGQLTRLIDDLMDVSHVVTNGIQLRMNRVVVSDIVKHAVETASPTITQRHHGLGISLPSEPLWLKADASRLEQVLVNLLVNAAKYTEPGGQIGLNVTKEGNECVLKVRDSGGGIAPELLPRIFDLFTRGEGARNREEGGLGIGLALAKRVVEMHGGSIGVQSSPEHGSEFTIHLPIAAV